MSHVNRTRAHAHLLAQGLDALVLAKPENFTWATGAHSGVASFFRRAGSALALVPLSAQEPIGAITTELFAPPARRSLGGDNVLTHTDWVETADIQPWLASDESAAVLTERAYTQQGRTADFSRPAVFDARTAFAQLGALLKARGLHKARIGLDLDYWPVLDFALLQSCLPQATWVDASATICNIKAVKSAREIECLQQAAALAEAGMRAALAAVRVGITRDAIAQAWKDGVHQSEQAVQAARVSDPSVASKLTGLWEYTTVGPTPWAGGGVLQVGDVLKFDVGCLVDGYSSDSGRTYVLGQPRARSVDIMAALHDAFAAGLEALKPGNLLSDVYHRAAQAMKRAGFARYNRGHFGHSLGLDTFCEVAPFIAAQAHTVIEPGMALAFETPFYVDGEGGFIIEDQFLITEHGAQAAWTLPRALGIL